jgi:hypothetical protein
MKLHQHFEFGPASQDPFSFCQIQLALNTVQTKSYGLWTTLYQEQAVFGKMKMDPAKWAQTQNAGEVLSLQWFFSQSVELMTDKDWLHCIRPMLLK